MLHKTSLKVSRMEQMEYFPYMEVPQLVQEMIADEIIQNLDFTDQKQFIMTSKYSNCIKKSRYEDGKWILKTSDNDYLNFSTEEEIVKFLKMVKIMKIDKETNFSLFFIPELGIVSPLKDLWLDAMEFLEKFHFVLNEEVFDINMEIVSKLHHLKECTVHNFLPKENLLIFVDGFAKLPNLTCHNDMDDELLKFLASKSNKSNPLKKLELLPPIGFQIDAVERFFKGATFADISVVKLKVDAAAWRQVKDMSKRIDKYKLILNTQKVKEVRHWTIFRN
uniref:F-box domain-containing protein n=1 Tax=Panagrolaimus sp. JU765 TaxID=591449 RepID=A0AC34RBV2_9BILA